jgi:periplasmic protein TonB
MRVADAVRWGVCFVVVLTFHAAGAMALLAHWTTQPDLVANAPVIMIELAPVPVAPAVTPSQLTPGPVQNEAKAEPESQPEPEKPLTNIEPDPVKPIEKAELPPLPEIPQAEPLPVVTPPPKAEPPKQAEKPKEKRQVERPKEKKRRHRHASLASAPSSADRAATRAAAPSPGANSHNPNAMPNWKSALVARLERYKRYPPEAHGEHGVAQLAFSVDRHGGVHHARIVRSSGSHALDSATLSLVARAAPLPAPPPEVSGAQIAITVPIRYNMR